MNYNGKEVKITCTLQNDTQGNFSITIPDFTKLKGFRTSTYQLLDALTVALMETGAKSPTVSLSLEEYMKKRGLKDKKEARKRVTDDLETLFNATISFKEKKNGQEQDFHGIRIIDSKDIRKGVITVTFGTVFYNILLSYPIMPYPAQLWTLNSNRNPNSFYLLRKLAEHKNINVGKKNEDIIAVKTLLAATPNLPSYEEVRNTGGAISKRIIKPFERDMDALEDTLTWTYCHSNNTPLTDEELSSMNYDTFINLLIKIDWKQYPDQTARLERKAKWIEQEKHKTSKKKKQIQSSGERGNKKGSHAQQKGSTKEEAVLALKNLLQDSDVSQDTVQTETKTSDKLQSMERVNEKDQKDRCIEIKKEQKMKYNGKNIEIICTLENGTPKITIIDDLKFPFINIDNAAEFLVAVYGGTKEEALLALNNCITGVVAKHLPESIKDIIVRNAVHQSISDELKDFVNVDRIVRYAISDEQKELLVEAKLRKSKLLII